MRIYTPIWASLLGALTIAATAAGCSGGGDGEHEGDGCSPEGGVPDPRLCGVAHCDCCSECITSPIPSAVCSTDEHGSCLRFVDGGTLDGGAACLVELDWEGEPFCLLTADDEPERSGVVGPGGELGICCPVSDFRGCSPGDPTPAGGWATSLDQCGAFVAGYDGQPFVVDEDVSGCPVLVEDADALCCGCIPPDAGGGLPDGGSPDGGPSDGGVDGS